MKYMINIIDKIGFSCYDVIDVIDIIDLGDSYNIITGMGDMFLEKEYCYVTKKIINEYNCINTIEYNTDTVNVYIESLKSIEDSIAC